MKPRKKHNPNKRAQKFFSRVIIYTWESDREPDNRGQNAYAKARTALGWQDLGPDTVNGIVRYRNNWIITVRALCKSPTAEWVEEETRIGRDFVLNDVDDLYEELKAEVLKAQRTDHVVDVGWIAGSFDRQPDDERLTLWGVGSATEDRREQWRAQQ